MPMNTRGEAKRKLKQANEHLDRVIDILTWVNLTYAQYHPEISGLAVNIIEAIDLTKQTIDKYFDEV